MLQKKLALKFIKTWWVFALYLSIYFIATNTVSIIRFLQFDVFYYDHSAYESSLWQAAHFKEPLIDGIRQDNRLINQLTDHFGPALYLLAPLYWFTNSYIAIFILQNLLLTLSAVFLIASAVKLIKSKLMSFTILISYTLFVGTQNLVISGLHQEFPALLTLSVALFAITYKKWKLYWVFLVLTLLMKENFVSISIGLGIFLFLSKEKAKGIASVFLSIVYYIFAMKVAVPLMGNKYVLSTNIYSPIESVVLMFLPLVKTQTMLLSFLTFSFLPLGSLAFLPAILIDYFVRFVLNGSPARINLGLHYNGMVALLLAYASLLGVAYLQKIKVYKKFINIHAILIIILVLVLHNRLHGPLGLFYNKAFYTHTKNLNFLQNFVKKIPTSDGYTMTLNNLGSHLTHEHKVVLLRGEYWEWMPQTIALDMREGQNPNNFWPLTEEITKGMVQNLEKDPNYKENKITDNQIIFSKKENVDLRWYDQFKEESSDPSNKSQ